MAREYVPIFLEWLETTQDLTPEEKGNLIDAVVSYASGKEYEHLLTGGCRIAFRFMKGQIDRNSAISDSRSKAGASKKEQPETNDSKPESNENKTEQNETNENKTEQTETNSVKEKEKEKEEEKEKDKENKKEKALACSERFAKFWMAYPRHEAKQKAQAAFMKLAPDDEMLSAMLNAIERQKNSEQWRDGGGRFIPHPTTWLNGRRWEDEPPEVKPSLGKPVNAQQYEQRAYTGQQETPEQLYARLIAEVG